MSRRLLPLSALRAFEAAANLGGFTQAAKKLNLTQGAVSYQVRLLEQQLGTRLFLRKARGVVLTEEGRRLAHSVTKVFDVLEETLEVAAPRAKDKSLSVTAPVSLGTKWLMSRVADFRTCHPGVQLGIVGEDHLVDFATEDRDVGIRYGKGDWPGTDAKLIHDEIAFPVCSPSFQKEHECELRSLENLLKLPLLSEEGRNIFEDGADWEAWVKRANHALRTTIAFEPPEFRIRSRQAVMVLQAAIEGQGIALARGLLAADDLAAGRLVRPVGLSFRADFGYHLVRRPGKRVAGPAQEFYDWIRTASCRTLEWIGCSPRTEQVRTNPAAQREGWRVSVVSSNGRLAVD